MAKHHLENNSEAGNESASPVSFFTKLRSSHNFRLILLLILMAIVAGLYFFYGKAKIALIAIFVILLSAFGMEASKTDFDVQKLIQTRSLQESKMARDEKGNILYDKFGNLTTDKTKGKKADEYNCSDFETQPEAQAFFINVGGKGNDINRLDGNKDGSACESLPKGKK